MLEDNIGYVQVTEFDEVTSDQYIAAVDDLKAQGMEGLIVDIRDNPGGLLSCVVDMLDYMLPEGTIVYTEDKNGEGDTYTSDAEHYFDLPLAVLVNGNSASALRFFRVPFKIMRQEQSSEHRPLEKESCKAFCHLTMEAQLKLQYHVILHRAAHVYTKKASPQM